MPLRVDIATGETTMYRQDVRLPGYVPLALCREYRSGRERSDSFFGVGWRLNLNVVLSVEAERLVYEPDTLDETVFSRVDENMEARHATGTRIQHHSGEYVLIPAPDRRLVFTKENARDGVIPLSRIEDGEGNDVHLFFDRGRLAGIVDSVGRQIRFEYRAGTVQRMQLTEDSVTRTLRTLNYSGADELVAETDASGCSRIFRYQGHLMVEYTNRCGGTQYAQYDGEERCHALWYGDGSEARHLSYDDARSSARVVGPTGQQAVYRFVPTGQVLERIDPADRSQNYYYNDVDRLVGYSDERETVQMLRQLDAEEGLLTCVEAEERAAYLDLDESLRVQATLDAEDRGVDLSYNGAQGPTSLRTERGAEWEFDRDSRGAVSRVRAPSGREVRLHRNDDERKLVVEDDEGRLVEDHVDECGRLVERTDGLGRRFQWRYTSNGRLKSVRVASQSVEFDYDEEGNVTGVRGWDGRAVQSTYDSFGRLQEWDGPQGRFNFRYARDGTVRAIENGDGRTTRYGYDAYGRIRRVRHPDGRETVFERDDDGTEVRRGGEDGGIVCQFSRSGDPQYWRTADGVAYECTYGPSGALLGADRAGDPFSFQYRDDGSLGQAGMGMERLRFKYDADGQVQGVAHDDESVLRCDRDARGRPSVIEVDDRRFESEFDAGNRLCTLRVQNRTWTFGYDALDHLIEWSGPGVETTPDEGVARLSLTEPRSDGGDRSELLVLGSAEGIILSLQLGAVCVPLWGQRAYPRGGIGLSPGLAAATVVRGQAPLKELLRPVPAFDRPRQWQQVTEGGLRWNYTEVPSAREVRRPGWTRLEQFFLKRAHYVASGFARLPGNPVNSNRRPAQSPDEWVTGSHVSAPLGSSLWPERQAGPHLYHPALGMRPGPKEPFDLLRALIQTT